MKLPRSPGDKRTIVYDLETFPNWFCVVISNGESTKVYASHLGNIDQLSRSLASKSIVLAGFNNHAYDDIILRTIIANPAITPRDVNDLSNRIIDPIDDKAENLNFKARYSPTPWAYSIDVFQLLNGKGSLKEHACRAHAQDVGESPHPFGQDLPEHGRAGVTRYCQMDVANTAARLAHLWPLVNLRDKLAETFDLGERVYCLSEPGIAQATFLKLHRERSGQYSAEVRTAAQEHPDNHVPKWDVEAIVSERVSFSTGPFQDMLFSLKDGVYARLDANGAKWELRAPLLPDSQVVRLAGVRFQLGVGGLHSIDDPGIFTASAQTQIVDLDVTSYYPSIIINERLYPGHIGPGFADNMRTLRDRRVAAKRSGDKVTADALKLVLNSTFGKLNDVWSPLRSVPSALRVTVNGQLFLLMLIEKLGLADCKILSANTDGVTISMPKTATAEATLACLVADWEKATGFDLERTDYASYARRDVNSYVALTTGPNPKTKLKGAFQPETDNGGGLIIKRAAVAFLAAGIPIHETVRNATLDELTFYQRCKNGGNLEHDGVSIGRLARWYASINGASIRRKNPNGTYATLPHAHKATLVMNLDDVGCDIDFDHYETKAQALVNGCHL